MADGYLRAAQAFRAEGRHTLSRVATLMAQRKALPSRITCEQVDTVNARANALA